MTAALRGRRLAAAFYQVGSAALARALLGTVLVHRDRAGVIVETEAYLGVEDRASHARFGPTARNRVMFGPGGVAYVYLCYGVHEMFNVVSGLEGEAGAVLIRAMAPLHGLPDDVTVGRGPGKVTRALRLDRSLTGRRLDDDDELFIAAGAGVGAIAAGPRIGVDYAGASWSRRRLRVAIRGHAAVSKPPPWKK